MVNSLIRTIMDIASELAPRKSLDQVIEEQNTKTVYYPRVGRLPKKYVYGKAPGESLVKCERHPEGRARPSCRPETSPEVVRRHIAICQQETGSHGGLCDMCRKLNNPKRMDLLVRLYKDARPLELAGLTVTDAVDKSGLNQPATSQYLRQLAELGLVRRMRSGKLVSYAPDFSAARPCIADVAAMMRDRIRKDAEDKSFVPVFRVMMGVFRSKVVRFIAAGGDGRVESLCDLYEKRAADIMEDLKWAVHGGLLDLDSEDEEGTYRYIAPADPIARRIVELS